ncbi:hypothetical protein NH340_JMT02504 [Sarcoptes scabiei]|nr:hypothetical protein NH340_JMT02504 [Sarcoptes scabiei]
MCRSIRIETNPICLVNFSKMSNNQTLTNCCCYDSRCCTENRIAQPHLNESFHSNGLNLKPSNYRSNIRSDSIMIVNPSKRIDSDIGNDYSDEIRQNYHSDRNHRYRCRICCTRNNFIDSFRESSSTSQQRRNEEFYFDRNIIGSPPLTDQCRCLPYHLDRFICQQSKLFQQGDEDNFDEEDEEGEDGEVIEELNFNQDLNSIDEDPTNDEDEIFQMDPFESENLNQIDSISSGTIAVEYSSAENDRLYRFMLESMRNIPDLLAETFYRDSKKSRRLPFSSTPTSPDSGIVEDYDDHFEQKSSRQNYLAINNSNQSDFIEFSREEKNFIDQTDIYDRQDSLDSIRSTSIFSGTESIEENRIDRDLLKQIANDLLEISNRFEANRLNFCGTKNHRKSLQRFRGLHRAINTNFTQSSFNQERFAFDNQTPLTKLILFNLFSLINLVKNSVNQFGTGLKQSLHRAFEFFDSIMMEFNSSFIDLAGPIFTLENYHHWYRRSQRQYHSYCFRFNRSCCSC